MSVITTIRQSVARWIAPEARALPQQVADALTVRSSSGVAVTEATALTASAVFAAIRVIAETVAQVDWEIYQKSGEAEIEIDDHPLYRLLDEEPNPEMTAFSWRIAMLTSYYLHGNMLAEIERNGAGLPVNLWWIHPSRVHVMRDPGPMGRLFYRVTDADGLNPVRVESANMYHVPLLASDGVTGRGLIQRARNSIGLSLGMEEYSGSSFANGARPAGLLKHPGKLTADARSNIRSEWEALHRGVDKAGRTAVLQEGMEFQPMQMSAVDAQLLEQRQFQISEIARWFNIPPHLLRDLSRATFGNIEHQGIEYQTYTIRPLCRAMEQEAQRKLVSRAERSTIHTELDLDDLQLIDRKSRFDAYAVARQNGWMSANEIRDEEGMNPIAGEEGDAYLINGNMIPLGLAMAGGVASLNATPAPVVGEPSVAMPEEGRAVAVGETEMAGALAAILEGELSRLLTKERNAATRAAGKPSEFLRWLDDFYGDHAGTLEGAIGPTVRAIALHTGRSIDPGEVVRRHVEQSRQALLTAAEVSVDRFAESVESCVRSWDSSRAAMFAQGVLRG
jgi:HK97 family phage portal protein